MAPTPYVPLFVDPKQVVLDMAREHSLPELLRLVVTRIAESPRVALARIWLIHPTENCTGCPTPAECRGQPSCLHLVASAGRSAVDPRVQWDRTDGTFRRFPLGVRKVGRIAATGEATEVPDLSPAPPDWVARPDWVRAGGLDG